jgi:Protein of unknown function (DUF3631)
LLEDIKATFADKNTDRLWSAPIAEALHAIEGRPWLEWGRLKKPISANQIAGLLKPFGIAPEQVRIGERKARGYELHQFADAFERYLGPQGVSRPYFRYKCDEIRTSGMSQTGTPNGDVPVQKCEKSNNDGICTGSTVWNGGEPPEGAPEALRVCAHCGDEAGLGNPVEHVTRPRGSLWLHARCIDRADFDDLADQGQCHGGDDGDDDLSIPELLLRR